MKAPSTEEHEAAVSRWMRHGVEFRIPGPDGMALVLTIKTEHLSGTRPGWLFIDSIRCEDHQSADGDDE